ncbi:MAG: winged helix-turn-helix transcriptional regulator [Euryarchaeota archaeon]|nr:winged helix-turn-helix transcriptional regulator [Euryarchaeota archaeon]
MPTLHNLVVAMRSEVRRRILRVLSDGEMHISAIARALDMPVSSVSRHCRVLEELGLVERRCFGRTHVLRLSSAKELEAEPLLRALAGAGVLELQEDELRLIAPEGRISLQLVGRMFKF